MCMFWNKLLSRIYKWAFLFVVTQVTETRTGPLGCSNYDNLDSVSSVLVQSPENKVQLQGLSDIYHFYCDCHDMCILMESVCTWDKQQ